MSEVWRLRCPAKINLGLEIERKRGDGFHDIRTLFVAVDLADDLEVEPRREAGIVLTVEGASLSAGPDNLVVRAAEAARKRVGAKGGLHLLLRKRIPLGAGLGGGSSDAAMALMALDLLWGGGLGARGLQPLAEELGSDVPFFLHGGACLGLGRGERLFPLEVPALSRADLVIACPNASLSSAQVYSDWDAALTPAAGNSRLRRFIDSALTGAESWDALANDLEAAAVRRVPAIASIKATLAGHGACAALMSGSGPSAFGVFLESQQAEAAARELSAGGHRVFRCRSLQRAEYREFTGLPDQSPDWGVVKR